MDQLQSAKSALQQALAEVEAAIASLSTAPGENEGSHDSNKSLAGSKCFNGLIEGHHQPRPSKASVHIDREELPDDKRLDPRFQQDKWIRPKPSGDSCFSGNLLHWAAMMGPDDEGVEYPIFILRHRDASECTAGGTCESSHWELIDDCVSTRVEGCIELQLVCMRTEHVERQMSSMSSGEFHDCDELITIPPCQLFNDLLPDFSSVTEAGYQVVLFRLVESWEDERFTHWINKGVWMDNHGRLLRDMDSPVYE
ncbi:uncharacterized protein BKA55DRAFT_547109 [Fusarium redolens]|uniref:Uncharacterized protein n=1 Tax=Fusarium redolens TaxID=48865 RepID=A0A9P9JK80_FUSRE|nr:uncharacterized protein BKA55DRAFT_547109 [Fusarium redolens]KAH7205820.1 hypothetical protein BKA55DRAFT_547109 [Fusarium redolens]